jgi:hypothetical protein
MTAPAVVSHDRLVIATYLLAEDVRKILAVTLDDDRLTPWQKQRVMDATCRALCDALDREANA